MKPLVVFTGGHHNSALEIAKILQKDGFRVSWVGHKFTARSEKSLSAEYQEVVAANIPFFELKAGKFYKKTDILEWLKICFGFIQSFFFLLKNRPKLIYSSGGYLSVPVVISGWLLGIPSITHEQTVVAGWANKAIGPFVKKILLTHKSSVNNYPKTKSVVVGLPLRSELFDPKKLKEFDPPLIYITCGKQGSHIINQSVFPIIPELVKHFTVVHQTGSSSLTKDVDRARRLREKLADLKDRYVTAPYFFSEDASTYIKSSSIIVSRSGAHTIYELMSLGKRAVLIPIPWVSHNEQFLNAKLASQEIGSVILEEKDLNPDSLLEAIQKAKKIKPKAAAKLLTDATEKIVKIIYEFLKEQDI